jgi:hypothetical protein
MHPHRFRPPIPILTTGFIGLVLVAAIAATGQAYVSPLQDRPAPDFPNTTWINSAPLRLQDLRGKVVLLEFWTYG